MSFEVNMSIKQLSVKCCMQIGMQPQYIYRWVGQNHESHVSFSCRCSTDSI